MDVKESFYTVFAPYLFKDKLGEVFELLYTAYTGSNRYYHNIGHIQNILKYSHEYNPEEPLSFYIAIWFHDYVYDVHSKDNEERSSEEMLNLLRNTNIPEISIKLSQEYILSTIKHFPRIQNGDCEFFLDCDLAILGSDKDIYLQFQENVRKEYSHISDGDYRKEELKY